jgi:hypothetical protein
MTTSLHSHEDLTSDDPEEIRMNLAYHLCGAGRDMADPHKWKWEDVKDTHLFFLQEAHAKEHDEREL